jgi:uncharacterized lipoprotein YbaY/heat shock protein HslJ
MISRWIVAVVAAALAGSCSFAMADGLVTGTASFRERIAPPPDAAFEAVIEDVSRADAPAIVIGRTVVANAGTPPYDFSIEYDSAEIDERNTYSVRTRLVDGERLLFTSDTAHPVITRGAPLVVDVRMVKAESDGSPVPSRTMLDLPATFRGDLPCADCAAIRYTINFWPDDVFHLRRIWNGTDLTEDTIGQWTDDPARGILTLTSGEDSIEFEVLATDRIRLLARDGTAIVSDLNYDLVSDGTLDPIDMELPIRGMVTIPSDSPRITECLTGQTYALSREGDFATLESAYLAAGVAQGSRLLASFDGRIRRGGDAGDEDRVEVRKFTGVWPDETCAPRQSDASLTNTYWKILRLGSAEIVPTEGATDPHLTLQESEMAFAATVGCNNMFGRFTVSGDRLVFTGAGSTMMACPPPLDEWERQLSLVLAETAGWRVDGQALELTDADGGTLALFQAVHLR